MPLFIATRWQVFLSLIISIRAVMTAMIVRPRLIRARRAMSLTEARAAARRTLPKVDWASTQNLGDVQCQNSNGKKLASKTHDLA